MAARGPQALPRRVLGRARSSAAQGVGGGETWDLEALKKESLRAVDLPSFRQPTRLQVIEKIPAVNALLGESEDYRRVRECVDRGDTEGVESSIARRSGVGKEIGIFWYTCWLQAADSRCKRRLAPVSAAELRRVVAEVEARGIRRGPDFCLWLARVYVRLGDSPAAFETLRGMRTTGFIIDTSTLNNVLAASTNQEASVALFNHMVLTYDLQPNLKTYEHFRRLCVTDEEELELRYFMATAWKVVAPPIARRARQLRTQARKRRPPARPKPPSEDRRREDAAGLQASSVQT